MTQRLKQLSLFDRAAGVSVVGLEAVEPLIDVRVQSLKLHDRYCPTFVSVEHRQHQSAGLVGKVLAFSIHKCRFQLISGDLARAVFVDLREDSLDLRIHLWTLWWSAGIAATAALLISLENGGN